MNPFPYGVPGEATYAQCDPLIVDLVRRINADEEFHVRTADAPTDDVLSELAQVAAMCLRYWETGDRYRGDHWPPEVERK